MEYDREQNLDPNRDPYRDPTLDPNRDPALDPNYDPNTDPSLGRNRDVEQGDNYEQGIQGGGSYEQGGYDQGTGQGQPSAMDKLKGKLQQGAGKLTGNEDMEAEGRMRQEGGNVGQGYGPGTRGSDNDLDQ